jgi:hypothetical protein
MRYEDAVRNLRGVLLAGLLPIDERIRLGEEVLDIGMLCCVTRNNCYA